MRGLNLPKFEAEGVGGGGTGTWRDQLADEYKGDAELAGFNNITELARGFKERGDKLSSFEPIPDEYSFNTDSFEVGDLEYDVGERQTATAGLAKELGLNQTQAQKLLDFIVGEELTGMREDAEANADAAKDAEAEGKAKRDACEAELREAWGDDFDANLKTFVDVATKFWPKEFQQLMADTGIGNNATFIKGLTEIGKAMSEDTLIVGDTPGAEAGDDGDVNYEAMADADYGDTTPARGLSHPEGNVGS